MAIRLEKYLLWIGLILFALLNTYFIATEKYYPMAIPLGLVLVWAVLYRLKELMLFVALLTPFSLNLENLKQLGGVGFYFPTEPILAGVLLVFIVWSFGKERLDKELWRHPVSVVVIIGLIWLFITSMTSSLPLISFKFLASRLWFVIPLFFLMIAFFKDQNYLKKYFWMYIISLALVIIYTMMKHAANGFDEQTGHYVMDPFYKDHTSYGAVIAMFIPLVLGHIFSIKLETWKKGLAILLGVILTVGLIFSYTRAAWLSLVGALGVFIVMRLRIKFWLVFSVMFAMIAGYIVFQDDIMRELERNRQDSSENFTEHIQSMTNVSTDASNLERLNRWSSAMRMFEQRPFFGWGPGTYMFQYSPFQKHSETTIISTNLGDAGNAHSEYLGPLCETGVLGLVFFLCFVIMILKTGIELYYKLEDPYLKMLCMCMLLGLITYFIHGVLNNFLDTDKVSVPFWGFSAGIVALDIYQRNRALKTAKSS
jgi:putative inorganic carbon (hco3(-)) transporter